MTFTCVYGGRQTAKITSDFLFFSCYPYINHTIIEKCLLLVTPNANVLILLYRELKTDGKSFIFAVCRLPFAVNVMLNLSNSGSFSDTLRRHIPSIASTRERTRAKHVFT